MAPYPFDEVLDTEEGWAKENRHYWLRDWRGYLEWFFSQCFTEPHSTKQVEDCVGWGQETNAETILAGFRGWATKELDPETVVGLCARVALPQAFAGYVTGFDPAALGDRQELRERLGWRPEERVVVVTVGGSGWGWHCCGGSSPASPRPPAGSTACGWSPTTGAEETDMQDWKAGSLPIVTLRGWGYHEAPHRRKTSKPRRPRRSVVRRGVAIIGGLLGRAGG